MGEACMPAPFEGDGIDHTSYGHSENEIRSLVKLVLLLSVVNFRCINV